MAGDKSTESSEVQSKENIDNGLVLYYHHHSFYAQKVIMTLYEKRIAFKGHLVDITKGEQYKSWFLGINPKGEVPVLSDGVKLIPDSNCIIDYLEDNFSNGKTIRLIPNDLGPEIKKKILYYRSVIDKIPANVITVGSIINAEFSSKLRYPFILPAVRNHLKDAEYKSSAKLREYAEQNPESRSVLLKKATYQDKKHDLVTDKESYLKLLEQTCCMLDEIEQELSNHSDDKPDWWLCCNRFTVADVALTILLDRLSRIGLENYFWGVSKRPNVAKYYERVKKRRSYKDTIPGVWTDISMWFSSVAPTLVKLGCLLAVIACIRNWFDSGK